ncbi:hypothetical protein ACFQO4_18430 [Saliphagus sp. GCM10025334]
MSLNPSAVVPPGYQNFHSPSSTHFDDRLKSFIQENALENIIGAYMTDIVPDVVDPNSSNVAPAEADTDRFLELLATLGHGAYDVICFSGQAFEALREVVEADEIDLEHNITAFTGVANEVEITAYRVWHYSNYGANVAKIPELERQLRYLNDEILE